MPEKASWVQSELTTEFTKRVISLNELSALLNLCVPFPQTVENHVEDDIAFKKTPDGDLETLKFVPERYAPLANGRVLTCKDFWLQVHIKGMEALNPIMGLKFMQIDDDIFEMSMGFLTSINDGELYCRPVLGHRTIEQVEMLVHTNLGKTLKPEP